MSANGTPLPCPHCTSSKLVVSDGGRTIYCEGCYDVEILPSGRSRESGFVARGRTQADTVAWWNEYVEDELADRELSAQGAA